MENITLKIGGMTCGGCVDSVARVLRAVAGVQKVEVSLERAVADVHYDPARTDRNRLKEAVESAGFDAAL